MKRYFILDSKKGLPHIKKIIQSKVITILRPPNDIIIFLGKKYFSRISPLEIHYIHFLILSNCFCVWYKLLCEEQLLLLLCLILKGSKDLNISGTTASVALKLSQLVRLNPVKKKRTGINCRHFKKNEPPLSVLIALAVHSQTSEKKIIEKLY